MTTVTDYDRVLTIDPEQNGKIVGIAIAVGEYSSEGFNEDQSLFTVYIAEHNFPEVECKDHHYFMTNYWFNLTDHTFVKVESEQPNEHAVYDPLTKTWIWDSALVLMDIRRQRDSLLTRSDWTQLGDNVLTDQQKADARNYRIKLRDVTNGLNNPVDATAVDWPTPPNFLQ